MIRLLDITADLGNKPPSIHPSLPKPCTWLLIQKRSHTCMAHIAGPQWRNGRTHGPSKANVTRYLLLQLHGLLLTAGTRCTANGCVRRSIDDRPMLNMADRRCACELQPEYRAAFNQSTPKTVLPIAAVSRRM